MAAMCLHFNSAKDATFEQYQNTFIEIAVLPETGETVSVNGFKHRVTNVVLDQKSQCAQVYLADFDITNTTERADVSALSKLTTGFEDKSSYSAEGQPATLLFKH